MTKAVYKLREDGDYDFVAAFDVEAMPDAPSNWPQEICDWLNRDGEEAIIVDCDLTNLPDVWVRHDARTPNNAIYKSHEIEPQKKL